ncbi:hypothetical protein QSJ18_00025 [Gordonia sp. ABSL1-1]|uniref:hypothetical protein n=1 Tax=Gordonia sp. ABSL1-1 TaxID=3053923 RepID=UPI002572D742|nr:hypothetical protein [Gordonia sp. ABSL1-1]MDL9935124.1 hypothetical protein [Gordonia sp. ABSL1-1]
MTADRDHATATMTADDGCAGHLHDCTYLRADDADPPHPALVPLVWGFAPLVPIIRPGFGVLTVLGRPPPWAIPSHLVLRVIRC